MATGFETASAELDPATIGPSGPLEIGLAPDLAGRIKFSGADAVGVAAADQTPLAA